MSEQEPNTFSNRELSFLSGETFALVQRPNLSAALEALERPHDQPTWSAHYYDKTTQVRTLTMYVDAISRQTDDSGASFLVIEGSQFPYREPVLARLDYDVAVSDSAVVSFDAITISVAGFEHNNTVP